MAHREPPADVARSTREAVGVFKSPATLQAAIDDLLSGGFHRADLSLLASQDAVETKLGHAYRKVQELEDASDVPSMADISTEAIGDAEGALVATLVYLGAVTAAGAVVASGGTIVAAIAAAVAAGSGGATLGTVLARLIGADRADRFAEHLERRGLLLWVRTRDAAHEDRAVAILRRRGAEDVHLHDLVEANELGREAAARLQQLVDEADRESFPASDAPSFSPSVSGGPKRSLTLSDGRASTGLTIVPTRKPLC